MPDPAWTAPPALPVLGLVDGFDEQDDEALVEFKTERGPSRRRKAISDPGTIVSAQTPPMTLTQRNNLLAFHRTSCNRGATNFTMDHPITGVNMTWRFESPPATRLVGIHFISNLSLRIMPG